MAEGGGSEDFVVLSKVRIGHKREFEFALKSQNEVVGCLGRTRSRKPPVLPPSPVRPAKRVKRPVGRPRKNKSLEVGAESEDEPKSDVVDDGVIDEEKNHVAFSLCVFSLSPQKSLHHSSIILAMASLF